MGTLEEVFAKIRTRILGFTPRGATQSLAAQLPGGLYYVQVPDVAHYPYAVARFQGLRRLGAFNGDRLEGDLEIQIYGRPRQQATLVEAAADGMQEALLRWVDVSSGVVFSREDSRDTLPIYGTPADREVAGVRLLFNFVAWPRYLSQYTVS